METKKPTTRKAPAKKAVAKKVAPKKAVVAEEVQTANVETPVVSKAVKTADHNKPASGKYIFATGRRKTAVANVRMFAGSEKNMVNRKLFTDYFSDKALQDTALRPLALTGLMDEYYFVASVNGGGKNSQVDAVLHGVAQTLAQLNDDVRKVLKKNGFLTRDDRKKERKKPGLRGARRAPQWAKR
jgi:small subunit ribosomal protein S9